MELNPCLGQTVNGYLLNIETTPVGVGLAVVYVVELVVDVVELASPAEFNEGQQFGRSSEQPINGTSIDPPSGKVRMVNWGSEQLSCLISRRKLMISLHYATYVPTSNAWPVNSLV